MKTKLALVLIFFLALVLRFFNLSDFRCLNWDEASFGYNAYSILTTGADEYGAKLPLQFKSVGDYKAPLYIYLMVPAIKLLGLNEFSVRFWPSFLGSLSVILVYFATRILTKKKSIALLTALLLAISPWHLQFTRAGADVAISNFFVTLGVLGFLLGLNGKRWGFILAFTGFAASVYSYFGERLFAPLIFVFMLILFRKEIIARRKDFVRGILVGIIFIIPIIPSLISGGHQEKIFKTTVFGYNRPVEYVEQIRSEEPSRIFYYLFHTGAFENSLGVVNRYLNHFSPSFLFLEGVAKDPRQFIYGMGLLYLIDLPFILFGFYRLLKTKNKYTIVILGWLLLGPVPAAITRDLASGRRSLNMLMPLLIIASIGYVTLYEKWKRVGSKTAQVVTGLMFLAVFTYFISFYLSSYFVFSENRSLKGPAGWQCGYKQLVSNVDKVKDNYQKIIVDTTYQGPYIFFLFYENYSPEKYQRQARLIQSSADALGEGAGYDKYNFRSIYWPYDRCLEDTLFAGPPDSLPQKDIKAGEAEIVDKIYFPNGEEAFRMVKVISPDKFHCSGI
jgi:4-amino-4-deoxy-L-arabinose transferase-like glycosyltransferase